MVDRVVGLAELMLNRKAKHQVRSYEAWISQASDRLRVPKDGVTWKGQIEGENLCLFTVLKKRSGELEVVRLPIPKGYWSARTDL